MLGYFIGDKHIVDKKEIEKRINKLKTFSEYKRIETDFVYIYLLINKFDNNYLYENEKYFLFSTGSVVYKHNIRSQSLKMIVDDLENNNFSYNELYGHYNLCVINKINNRLFLYTDKEGLQASFCYKNNENYLLSNNFLLLASLVSADIDHEAIVDFIHVGNFLMEKTIFSFIKKIKPSSSFTNTNGKWESRNEWKIAVKILL